MKLDDFYYLEYSDYCLHFHCDIPNVSTDASFGLFEVFHVELGKTHRTSNWTLNFIHVARVF